MTRMADIFRGRIIDVTDKSYTIELTGAGSKLDAFLNALERGSILETVRTGASVSGAGTGFSKFRREARGKEPQALKQPLIPSRPRLSL
jgi:hypothetical protein